jgi:hypothetical protein
VTCKSFIYGAPQARAYVTVFKGIFNPLLYPLGLIGGSASQAGLFLRRLLRLTFITFESMAESSSKKYVDWTHGIVGGTNLGGKHSSDIQSENGTILEIKGSDLFPHNPRSATRDSVWNGLLWHDRRKKVYEHLITMGFWGDSWPPGNGYAEYRFFDFSYAEVEQFVEDHCNTMRCAPEKGWSKIRRFVLQNEVPEEVLRMRYRLRPKS